MRYLKVWNVFKRCLSIILSLRVRSYYYVGDIQKCYDHIHTMVVIALTVSGNLKYSECTRILC